MMTRITRSAGRFKASLKEALGISLGHFYLHEPRSLASFQTASPPPHETTDLCFSIVMPSYNQGRFICESLRSVLSQSYSNLHFVIQDSVSRDETPQILALFNDVRLEIHIEKDMGQADGLNRGFGRTSGDIMSYLNSDDILLPDALAHVAAYFNQHPDVDAVYGDRLVIDENSWVVGNWRLPPHDQAVMHVVDYVPQETLFWRRSAWLKVGGNFDDKLQFAMDWDFILRLQVSGAKIVHLPIFLGGFRVHRLQKTHAAMTVGQAEMKAVRNRYVSPVRSWLYQLAHVRYLWRHMRIETHNGLRR